MMTYAEIVQAIAMLCQIHSGTGSVLETKKDQILCHAYYASCTEKMNLFKCIHLYPAVLAETARKKK